MPNAFANSVARQCCPFFGLKAGVRNFSFSEITIVIADGHFEFVGSLVSGDALYQDPVCAFARDGGLCNVSHNIRCQIARRIMNFIQNLFATRAIIHTPTGVGGFED